MSESKDNYTMKDAWIGFLTVIGALVVLVLSITYGILMNSILLFHFYKWFALPVFNWLTPVTFVQAVGLSILLSVFRKSSTVSSYNFSYKGVEVDKNPILWISIVGPWIIFLIGYIIHLLIK